MDKISSTTSSTAPASALHHEKEEPMVASPPGEEAATAARNIKAKQAWQQQAAGERKPRPQQDQALNCPRCDSTNTKFCYYNNYSMTQPRYFCKACRRYWTKGGTLRNVPVGGGSRKNKQQRASAASSAPPASSSSSSGSKKVNNITQQLMMMPTAVSATTTTADFSNVLPVLMSTGGGFELPTSDHHQVSLPFVPLSLSSDPDGGSWAAPLFMDMLRGGFLDSNGLALPFPPLSFGAMPIHGHVSTDQHATQLVGPLQGVEEVKPMAAAAAGGLQWLSPQHGNINHGGFAAGSAGGVVQKQEEEVVGDGGRSSSNKNHNNVGGASGGSGSGSGSASEYYDWQRDLINSSSLI